MSIAALDTNSNYAPTVGTSAIKVRRNELAKLTLALL